MNKVLVTGASGMLGATLCNLFKHDYDVYATGNSNFDEQYKKYLKFDLKSSSYERLIDWSQPNIVIHCAALTNGNKCEESPEIANLINGHSVEKLLLSVPSDTTIIYISTDAVFPSALSMARELDKPEPESYYGKSKLLGESYLHGMDRKHFIIRTTIVGGNINKNKRSFIEWIIQSSLSGDTITLFDDVVFTPISIWDLCLEIKYLLKSNIDKGTYHISGTETVSKYNFGVKLLSALNYSIKNVVKGSIENFESRAKRSKDQSLDSSKYMSITNRKLPDLNKTIDTLKMRHL